jgi:hypothetical protein
MIPHGQKSHQKEFSRWDCFSSRNQVPNKFKRLRRMKQKLVRQGKDVEVMILRELIASGQLPSESTNG